MSLMAFVLFSPRDAPYKPLSLNNLVQRAFYFGQVLRDLAWILFRLST
jgi:hypothetical protein